MTSGWPSKSGDRARRGLGRVQSCREGGQAVWQLREGGVRQGYRGWTESSPVAPGQVNWERVPSTFTSLGSCSAESSWTFAAANSPAAFRATVVLCCRQLFELSHVILVSIVT